MTLSDLKNKEVAYVESVGVGGALQMRLEEMGLVRGQAVKRLYAAPLGTPIVFKVMGQMVSLRRSEAALVSASPEPPADEAEAPAAAPAVTALPAAEPHVAACAVGCPSCGGTHQHKDSCEGALTIALVGNPNCGKTAFFNAACGGHERTGNYAGVTVTSVEGHTELDGRKLRVIDLPGTYSLHSFSPDEAYVMHELAKGKVDVVLNVIDVNNLERNLLLTTQLRTMGKPVVCVLNMYDEFSQSGSRLDLPKLRERLGLPCVTTIARTGEGIAEALRAAIERADCADNSAAPAAETADADIKSLNARRYRSIRQIVADIYQRNEGKTDRATRLLDRLTAHGLHAYLVYAALMFCSFWLTFELGQYPMDWIDSGVGLLTEWVESTLPDGFLRDLLVNGVLGGVGSVIVFLPNILILYLCISLLEDSGYLARAAMLADPLLSRAGLHGKSFIPMLMGFGCNVPAVMATRTIENRKARLLTMLVLPFMSCSARLPVYVILCGAFFPDKAVYVMCLLYALGIIIAFVAAILLNRCYRRGADSSFVMEIPPYRAPQAASVLRHTWEKGQQYLRKMGGIILVASLAVWLLGYFPRGGEDLTEAQQQEQSYLGHIGHAMEPVFSPLGFDWRMDIGVLAGAGAKELMVSTLGVLYDCPEDDAEAETADDASQTRLAAALKTTTTPAAALAYMVFALLYFPCMATIAAIRGESGRWRYALFAAAYTTVIAYLAAWGTYMIFR
ncbi:MAG: ferrous iron transport protein B [Bacteroidales bacterium]|nr:ferrous iron transport protein B [Bacteroidales bacterium]